MKAKKQYKITIDDSYVIDINKGPDDAFSATHYVTLDDATEPIEIKVDGVFQAAASIAVVCGNDLDSNEKIMKSNKTIEKIKIKQYVKLKKVPFDEMIYILTGGNNTWHAQEFIDKKITYDAAIAKDVWGDSIWEFVHDVTNFYELIVAFKEYRDKFIANGFGNYISILNEKRNDIN